MNAKEREWGLAARVEALATEWDAKAVPGEWSQALHPGRAADALRSLLTADEASR